MKRATLKVIFSLFTLVLFLSSCLGDGESSVERTGDFSYIGSEAGQKYAATSMGRIASGKINDLTSNKCYFISYKLTGSPNSSGIYNAENVNVENNEYPIDAFPLVMGAPVEQPGSVVANNMGTIIFDSGNYFGDNWLFYYNCSIKKGEKIVAEYYYDKNNQIEANEPIKKGQLIIDIRFRKTSDETVSGNDVAQTLSSVSNLKNLKDLYRDVALTNSEAITEEVNGRTYVFVPIKFRYYVPNTDKTKPAVLTTIGRWNLDSGALGQAAYYFAYEKN